MNSMESSEEKYGDRRVVLEHNETKERIWRGKIKQKERTLPKILKFYLFILCCKD